MDDLARAIRQDILRIAKESGHGHIPTCFSIVETLLAVYGTMNHRPSDPGWDARDLFVLSKGHAALAHYLVLARLGYFAVEKVDAFGAFKSDFGCHADRTKIPGVEVSTGSLGHGIGVAVGMALAQKIKGSPRRVFTIVGDGESNEGTVWEATMVAVARKLDNLTIIYDDNRSHGRGLQIRVPERQFAGFGCDVTIADGHSIDDLTAALVKPSETVKVVVAHTRKGYGCPTLIECQYEWHRRSPTDAEYAQLMKELAS